MATAVKPPATDSPKALDKDLCWLLSRASHSLHTQLTAALTEPTRNSVLVDVFQSDTSGLFILILAIVGIAGEWRHRTITSSLLAEPDRLRFLAAKTLAFAVAGAALSVVISIAVAAVGFVVLEIRGLPTPDAGDLIDLYARNVLVAALGGVFGIGIGALVRNQAIAIVGVLLVAFAIGVVLSGAAAGPPRKTASGSRPAPQLPGRRRCARRRGSPSRGRRASRRTPSTATCHPSTPCGSPRS